VQDVANLSLECVIVAERAVRRLPGPAASPVRSRCLSVAPSLMGWVVGPSGQVGPCRGVERPPLRGRRRCSRWWPAGGRWDSLRGDEKPTRLLTAQTRVAQIRAFVCE
jgi:hypothetical protein